jgi:acyl carrier protein
MGLETVELVIRFEEAFGITISDEVATSMTTPRAVTDYIVTQVATTDRSACLSQQAFYFLRRGFSNQLHLSRRALHPDVSLQTLIPKETRKTVWHQLQTEMGPNVLPHLVRPSWLFYLLFVGTVFLSVFVSYVTPLPFQIRIFLALAMLAATGITLSLVTRPFKTEFRRRFRTVAALVDYLLLHSPHSFKRQERVWTRAQIAETVRAIIVDVTGKTNFTEDSHFINDMRLD